MRAAAGRFFCGEYPFWPGLSAEKKRAGVMRQLVTSRMHGAVTTLIHLHASDIHIETNPGEEFTRIRLRRDGDLELYRKLSPKVMARLDVSERRRPHDAMEDVEMRLQARPARTSPPRCIRCRPRSTPRNAKSGPPKTRWRNRILVPLIQVACAFAQGARLWVRPGAGACLASRPGAQACALLPPLRAAGSCTA